MRFHQLGPDFPEELIDDLLEGDAVFLCGAGVSFPQLPGFERLVTNVYARLGEERTPAEEHAFTAKRYEEVLGALARRLVRSNDVIDAAAIELQVPAVADTTHHDVLIRLSRDSIGRPIIVTTNFDTLFERSLAASHSSAFAERASVAGQDIPAPGSSTFTGIVHLHGRLADTELNLSQTDLVLTSAQYGEAYLRAGWAARFLFDLTRCRTLVLVGYGAGDAPVRYILNVLEGDRERFSDLRRVYAIGSTDRDEQAAAAPWQALAVEPVLFQPADGDAYEPLWTSLGHLADLVEEPDKWRQATIERVAALETSDATEHDKRALKWALGQRADLFELLVQSCADPEWFAILSVEMKAFDARARAWLLAHWFAGNWTDRRRFLSAVKYVENGHLDLSQALFRELDHRRPENPIWEKAWQLLAESASERGRDSLVDFQLKHRLDRPFVADTDLGRLVNTIGPHLTVEEPFRYEEPPAEITELSDIARFSIEGDRQEVLRDALDTSAGRGDNAVRLLRLASERLVSLLRTARDAELIDLTRDTTDWTVPSVVRHEQNRHRRGLVPLTVLITSLLPTAIEVDRETVLHLVSGWATEGFHLTTRLWMHGLSHAALFNPDEAIHALTTDRTEAFWSFAQEFVSIISAQLANASLETVSHLVERILMEGPQRYSDIPGRHEDLDWKSRARDRDIWLRLTAISEVKDLPQAAQARLDDIHARRDYLARQLEEQDLFRTWSSGVRSVRGKTAQLVSAQATERLSIADRLEESRDIEDQAGWSEYCREDPIGALAALKSRAVDMTVVPRWSEWLQVVPHRRQDGLDGVIEAFQDAIDYLDTANVEAFAALAAPLSSILERAPALGLTIPDSWRDRLWLAAESDPGVEWTDDWELYDRVINSPGGRLAEGLLQAINDKRERTGAVSEADLSRLRQMILSRTYAGSMARGACARDLGFLYTLSPRLAGDDLGQFLTDDNDEGQRLRAVLVEHNSFTAEAEIAFADFILRGITESRQKNISAANAASHLVRAVLASFVNPPQPRGISPQQALRTMRQSTGDIRVGALTIMTSWLQEYPEDERGHAWTDVFGPTFDAIWPRDRTFLSNDVSREIFGLAAATGSAFPAAVSSLLPYITIFSDDWINLHDLERDGARLATLHPEAALDLVWAACRPPCKGRTSDIAGILDAIAEAQPALAVDRRVHKLRLRAVSY